MGFQCIFAAYFLSRFPIRFSLLRSKLSVKCILEFDFIFFKQRAFREILKWRVDFFRNLFILPTSFQMQLDLRITASGRFVKWNRLGQQNSPEYQIEDQENEKAVAGRWPVKAGGSDEGGLLALLLLPSS